MNFSYANERRKKREETIGLSLVIQLAVLDYPDGKDTKNFKTNKQTELLTKKTKDYV